VTRKQIALLLLITIGAVLVHGYHPAAEDGELYLPGIKKDLNPALYPFNSQFFMSHAHMTLFDELVAATVRITHLPFDYVIFIWHFACIFLFLLGCWRVARICFRDERAPWGSVALVAALLTIPVAGTALYIMDQYLSPRDLSTAGIMLVLAEALRGRFVRVAIGIVVIAALHPLMAAFGVALLFFLYLEERRSKVSSAEARPVTARAMLLGPLLPFLQPVSAVYRRLLHTNDSYFLVVNWPWYEWLGIFVPLLLLWWTARYGRKHGLPKVEALSRASIVFGVVFFAAALLFCLPRFAGFALLQPMRCLHLIFIVLFIFLGGVLAETVLKSQAWRWLVCIAPLCLLMFLVQRQLFPASEHLELPGRAPRNAWVQAFDWVRSYTPRDAIFALDPNYMNLPGEDEHGFHAIAERSTLASIHDNGAVSMFPALGAEWNQQVEAQQGWRNFQAPDFQRLRRDYGVTWVVLQRRAVPGLTCPYENNVVMVCRVE
jgi:hypothetical protein